MISETSKKYIERLLLEALGDMYSREVIPVIPTPEISTPDAAFGDYATNVALKLAKQAKKNPKELAALLIQELQKLDVEHIFEGVTEAGGFINFKISQSALLQTVDRILETGDLYGFSISGKGKKVVMEYSSPNTNKPLHIGHTRNDVYGAACINLLKSQGYQVTSCEIINDRGIHIMKSVLMYMKFGNSATPESEKIKPDHFVGKFYRMFGEESAKGEEQEKILLEEAQELLRKWEQADPEVRKVWQQMNLWFFEGVQVTYKNEGTFFDEVDYESQIYDKGRDIVLEGVKNGIFQKEEDGSVSVDLTDKGLDKKYLLRKDGTTIYITQDLYLWHIRNERYHPELAIVITAAEQSYHFKVLSEIFKLLKYPWAENFKHLPYEHVYLGKSKMSSRGGNTVSADELLELVKNKVHEVMVASQRVRVSPDDAAVIQSIAYGAIKYGYLKYEPNTRIYFDLEQTISIEGNTGPYIQYAYARINSILKKAEPFKQGVSAKIEKPAEYNLTSHLLHYSEAVELAAAEYKPNLLCNYLYELAAKFNNFYQEAPVLQEPDEDIKNLRLQLISATAQVIKNGLALLGIDAPEEM